jgi:poly(3-hydroxybutyrate) depolymerase
MKKMLQINGLILLMFLLQLSIVNVDAQESNDEIALTKGIMLQLPRFARTALPIDPIEKSIVMGTWKAPEPGDKVNVGDTTALWETVSANEEGWINNRLIRGGYTYFSVNSDKDQFMLLEENGNDLVYVNGVPRTGNRYGLKDDYAAWEPNFNYSILPVHLKKGKNDFLFFNTRTGRLKVRLIKAKSSALLNIKDSTLPDLLVGKAVDTWGAVVIINASQNPLKSFKIAAKIADNLPVQTDVHVIQPLTMRKIGFRLQGKPPVETGDVEVSLKLLNEENQLLDSATIVLQSKNPNETHKRTFISNIDGSVQYFAVNPAQDPDFEKSKALVLSVHGAGVIALNQANSYYGKTWAHIVAPTNRRPYGFNWEDWGRSDALEVLDICQRELNIDLNRIYLTGHSMGGHGAWHLGGTFPDRFAAIGPSAGWLSFWSYRVREKIEEKTPMQKMLMRPTSPSNTYGMAENYKQIGVYILHGADDDNVRADQSRQMVEHLNNFHKDFIYDEQPGQGHWWDISDEPGADCVDWAPMFDFFARHARPEKERIRQIEFITANPGVSSQNNWLTIEAQIEQLKLSHVSIRFDPGKRRFVGTTQNVARLSFDLSLLIGDDPLHLDIDGQKLENVALPQNSDRIWIEKKDNQWQVIPKPSSSMKGPHRYGTFKDAFNNRFMFVYGTQGTEPENDWAYAKARYDAEHFWYQGNGSIDVISDMEFDPKSDPDRNVILYGNAQTNSGWKALLGDSPVQVTRGKIIVGKKEVKGNNLSCLFIRPRPGSDIASVGAVSGTGIVGMKLTDRRPYLSPGYAYPDFIIFSPDLLTNQEKGVQAAGFFGLDWRLEAGEFVWNDK